MASVFCTTVIILWEKVLGFPHSDAGKLNAGPSSQIHTLPSHTPRPLHWLTGSVSGKLGEALQHWSEHTVFREGGGRKITGRRECYVQVTVL